MSNVVRHLLMAHPDARAIVLDLTPLDDAATQFFSPITDRLAVVQGDITDRDLLYDIANRHPVTHIVHGAMIAHVPGWEQQNPARYVDVNLGGTLNLLEWARSLNTFERFLYISSGAVYGDPTADHPSGLQPEPGPFNPVEFYGITKWASEHIVRRYGELFSFDTFSVRFGPVFGPMERPTRSRVGMSMPCHMMRALVEGRPLRLTSDTLTSGRDHLSVEDAAQAVVALLLKEHLTYPVYNIAAGRYITGQQLIEALQTAGAALEYEAVDEEHADVVMRPDERYGRWNGYAIDRVQDEIGWQPRPLGEQMDSYYRWVMDDPTNRCPSLP
jgi:nucleoside-diphosphate-sugar epimerase